jgi:hypothetical protein
MFKSFRRVVIAAASLAAVLAGGGMRHASASACGTACTGTVCVLVDSCWIVNCTTNTSCGDPNVLDYYKYGYDVLNCSTGPSPCYDPDSRTLIGYSRCGCLMT